MRGVRHATILLLLSSIACSLQSGPAVSPTSTALPPQPAPTSSMATAAARATASVVAAAAPLETQRIPEDDQVAYLPFEGDAADASGHHNDGTLYGPTFATDRFGRPNSALSFDGVDDHVLVLDSDSLEFTADFSLALWVRPTDDPEGHT